MKVFIIGMRSVKEINIKIIFGNVMNKCWNINEMYMRVKLEFNNWIFYNFCCLKVRICRILKCLCVNLVKILKKIYMNIYLFGVDIIKLE